MPGFPWAAAADAVGTVAGLATNWNSARDSLRATDAANVANRELMQESHRFQDRQSSTAYQRSVEDMRKAGLNPAVMLQGAGGAASSSAGGAATMQSGAEAILSSGMERSRNVKDAVGKGIGAARAAADLAIAHATEKLVKQQTATANSQQFLNAQETDEVAQRGTRLYLENELLKSELPTALRQAEAERNIPGLGYVDAFGKRVEKFAGPASSLGGAAIIRSGMKGGKGR